MCGIVGIFSRGRVAEDLYDSLIHLQHRGQDAAGILTVAEDFERKRGLGLVREVFNETDISQLNGSIGIGHTRYPTAGGHDIEDVQPLMMDAPYSIAIAHNGNLTNHQELAESLKKKQGAYFTSSIDSEVILHYLVNGLGASVQSDEDDVLFFEKICNAVEKIFKEVKGSYSVVATILGRGLLIFRDPHGIRPLVSGERLNEEGHQEYIFASENTMFYPLGFQSTGDVAAGEVIYVSNSGKLHRKRLVNEAMTPCLFEYVYFARPDSTLDEVSVYKARSRMGVILAKRWLEKHPELIPEVVIPAPFTSNTAAQSFANVLGVRYVEGLYKNPFVGRTFIMPGAKARKKQIRYKLSPQSSEIRNKTVLILDDSIVRGTTSIEIVRMLRESEAKAVYFVSACPPIIDPCYFGIDLPSRKDLIAANYSEADIAAMLEVDCLMYQELDDLIEAVFSEGSDPIKNPCMACMGRQGVLSKLFAIEERDALNRSMLTMNILIVGSGAREHAMAKAFAQSSTKSQLFCVGNTLNPGILALTKDYCLNSVTDVAAIKKKAIDWSIDLAIIGPEAPLEQGLSDELNAIGLAVVGPKKSLARLETSKTFTRNLMERYDIPGSLVYQSFTSMDHVESFLKTLETAGYVIKANGLMGGKGVKLSGEHLNSITEALAFCEELIALGQTFLIEEKLIGQEFTMLSFCDGVDCFPMPLVQDHKRAYENDTGPNTGGMGSYSDADHRLPFVSENEIHEAHLINQRVIQAIHEECGERYQGILYGSFMVTAHGLRLIEYNARFGDPEALNVLSILDSDFVAICQALTEGSLNANLVKFKPLATVCKYAVPEGYPDEPSSNFIVDASNIEDTNCIYWAGVNEKNGLYYASGSRTVAVVGVAPTITEAEQIAESEICRIQGNVYHRSDIGKPEVIERRIQMMKQLKHRS